MAKGVFGTPEEMGALVDAIEAVLGRGAALPVEQARKLKGYGIFAEVVNGELTFGVRIRTVAGRVTPAQLRAIAELAMEYGRDFVDITNRQGFQLHYLDAGELKEVLRRILEAGLTSKGGCGDTPRAITTCPVADIDKEQLFDVTPVVERVNRYYYEKWQEFGPEAIPRKFKVSITACPYLCSFPEINCVGLLGVLNDGREGFTVTVGGGLSTTPRIGKHMPVFVEKEDVPLFLEALVSVWKSDPKYRVRHRARIKFLVGDYGVRRLRELIEERLGKRLEDYAVLPRPRRFDDHMGVREQRNDFHYVGVPVVAGRTTGEKLLRLAELAEEYTEGGDVRVTPQQNLIVTNVPRERVEPLASALKETGFPLESRWASAVVADVAAPFCAYSSVRTKDLAEGLVRRLDASIGDAGVRVRVHVTGCPRDCGQHWIADIGLQGKMKGGEELYDVTIGGGWRRIGRVILKDVPAAEAGERVENLIKAYLRLRGRADESFAEFCDGYSLDQLARMAAGTLP